jgi:hypothetical protein
MPAQKNWHRRIKDNMANKDNKNKDINKGRNGAQNADEGEEGEELEAAEEKLPELTKAEKKVLWDAYRQATKSVKAAEASLATAKAQLSGSIQAIREKMGKGPFIMDDGRNLIARKRGGTWFFTSPSTENATRIDF